MKQDKDAAEFSALKQYDQFAEWLARSPFLPIPKNPFIAPEKIAWGKVHDIYLQEQQRRKAGWYCSFEDVYDEALDEMLYGSSVDFKYMHEYLDEAMEEYKKNVRIGVSKIMQLARKGMPEAQAKAAWYHFTGFHAARNAELSLHYANSAAAAGYEGVYALLALLHGEGLGTIKNHDQFSRFFILAQTSKHPGNYRLLGKMFAEGCLVEQNLKLGEQYLRKAVEAGDLEAMSTLLPYICDKTMEEHENDERFLLEKAEEGDPLAMYLCALYVAPGIERQEDLCVDENFLNKMFFWLVSAANAELPKAMDILEDNYDESLTLTDGTERWFSDFYDIIEPDGETSFRPEFVLK